MSFSTRTFRHILLPAALLALCCPPGQALALSADCPALFELYRACHSRGLEADSGKACLEDSSEAMARALAKTVRRNPLAAQTLVTVVCGTGCDDALSRLQPATRQEFAEAFCD
jgi:hypothetical protein